jgi:nickel transport protein
LLCLLLPSPARAHEVLHSIERGRAIALKAYTSDGEVLSQLSYQVFSPVDRQPYQQGQTDRGGYLSFVPDRPGKWRVKVADAQRHGLDTEVEVTGQESGIQQGSGSSLGFVLRPLFGLAVIGLVFTVLLVSYRRGKSA